ncbi:MAG TPA: hypothetical protein DDY37_00080 [Legionella sp.]|nr:hypothetical protein [Legionella sp.]
MKALRLYIMLIATVMLALTAGYWYSSAKTSLTPASFHHLPGWDTASIQPSLRAFQHSCRTFLKQNPEKSVGTESIPLQIKDWQPACVVAMSLKTPSDATIRDFFQTWFTPVEFYKHKPVHGLFTGYFMPLLHGSLKKTAEYSVPIYGLPSNLISANLGLFRKDLHNKRIVGRVAGNKLVPFYTREEISHGAIRHIAPVLFWIKSPMDRLFLEIEGSGAVELADGEPFYVGYAAENGAEYKSVASVLIREGVMTRDNASSAHIKAYLNQHPKEINRILNQNKSFVFFQKLKTNAALGAQGVPLTPGYSLAVDHAFIPYGTPTFLSTTTPTENNRKKPFNRLMVAQDTGGAIRGMVRGDVFWGTGKKAYFMANHMQNKGRYWLLLPRDVAARV